MAKALRTLARIGQPLLQRLRGMIARAAITSTDDSAKGQTIRARFLGVERTLERIGSYGFTSRPLPPTGDQAAEVLAIFPGGQSGDGIAAGTLDRRHRRTGLQPGEVVVHDDQDQYLEIARGGTTLDSPFIVRLRSVGAEVTVEDEAIELSVGSSSIRIEDGTITLTAAAINLEQTS